MVVALRCQWCRANHARPGLTAAHTLVYTYAFALIMSANVVAAQHTCTGEWIDEGMMGQKGVLSKQEQQYEEAQTTESSTFGLRVNLALTLAIKRKGN